jgi:hypothetical protein
MTTYQIVMNEEELDMFEVIRDMRRKKKAAQPADDEQRRRLSQTVLFYGRAGDRMIGPWDIAVEDAIPELATVGKELMGLLASDDWNATPELTPDLEDDHDSLLEPQSDHRMLEAIDEEEPLSWDEMKRLLPSFVTQVSCTVDYMKMSAADHNKLKYYLPGVEVRYINLPATEETPNKCSEIELPKGVRRAIFELDEESDVTVVEKIKRQFPWAETRLRSAALLTQPNSMNTPVSPVSSSNLFPPTQGQHSISSTSAKVPVKNNSAALRAPNTEPQATNTEPNQLFNRYLIKFNKMLSGAKGSEDFEYNYRLGNGWDKLPNARKEAIAHARCIQAQYGQFVKQEKRCSNCIKHGYMCRVYIPDLQPVANMDLGHGCQNCRIWDTNCDIKISNVELAPPVSETGPSPVSTAPASTISSDLSVDRGASEMHKEIPTLPQTLKRKPSPADQTNQNPKKPHIESVAEIDDSESDGSIEHNSAVTPLRDATPQSEVCTIAKEFGLEIAQPDILQQEYDHWIEKQVVRPRLHKNKVEDYYSTIVDLYIIGFHNKDTALQRATLLRFQKTFVEYTSKTTWPPLKVVMKAFHHLPQDSALRHWMEITHSFLWNTSMYAPYEKFKSETSSFSEDARAAFLFGLANGRCQHTEGGEIAVLEAWCDVHDHPEDGVEEQECKAERDRSSRRPLAKQIKKKEEEELRYAKRLIEITSGGSRSTTRTQLVSRRGRRTGKRAVQRSGK